MSGSSSRNQPSGKQPSGKQPSGKRQNNKTSTHNDPGTVARRVAINAMVRIDRDNAFANLVLPPMLAKRDDIEQRDKGFITELVYGTTRMMRACDFLVNRFVLDKIEPQVRAALRIGAYQLHYLGTPRHAAVGATVGAVNGRGRGVVNAVLRRVADAEDAGPVVWPNDATRLSYPNHIIDRLIADLGPERAVAALEVMNRSAIVHERDDGYVQDLASQRVVGMVDAGPGDLVVDLCAAPGGKATGIAAHGARVVATDLQPHRVGLIADNASRLEDAGSAGLVHPLVADGTAIPLRAGVADRVLVDAPCSGFGSLRRRADARWRIDKGAPERLAALQIELVMAGYQLLKPGGTLTYSVCTLTDVEGAGVRSAVADRLGAEATLSPLEVMVPTETSDGMVAFQLVKN